MDCIPYINDLQIEINILKDIKKNGNCDINSINEQIKEKEILIEKCKYNLSKLSLNSIEYRLYLKIMSGLSVTKAIESVAEENYINNIKPNSHTQIWKYYKNMKKIIKV